MAIHLTDDLLQEYRKEKCFSNPEKLIFHGVDGFDVYNPTSVFPYKGKNVICGRVERRDSEYSKSIFFYEAECNHFYPLENVPRFDLQDPYITKVSDYYVFGGTKVYHKEEDSKQLSWCASFYCGKSLEELEFLLNGPQGMKDIRLIELYDKRIGIFSRPQGKIGGRGKIGFTIVSSLSELTKDKIEEAPLLNLFHDKEWGGTNELVLLGNGLIGVLGHIAKFSEGDIRHYYPSVFLLNPETGEYTDMRIIAERADFLDGPFKREDLKDVLFSGGIVCLNEEYAILYAGVSDCEVQKIIIRNPFHYDKINFSKLV